MRSVNQCFTLLIEGRETPGPTIIRGVVPSYPTFYDFGPNDSPWRITCLSARVRSDVSRDVSPPQSRLSSFRFQMWKRVGVLEQPFNLSDGLRGKESS